MAAPSIRAVRPVATPPSDFDVQPIVYHVTKFFSHTCFGWIVDAALVLMGKKPKLTKIYRILHRVIDVAQFAVCKNWKFTNNNLLELEGTLNAQDRLEFNFDIRAIDWPKYINICYYGGRKYLLKEDPSNIPMALKRMRM